MIDSIYANHVDMFGLHIRSIADNGRHNTFFDDAVRAGVIYPNAESEGIINFFDPEAVDWWWKNGVMKVASMGVKFVKTDCGGSLRFPENTSF
nr:CAZy families GH31 protein [uncultured Bacteroides sp.]